MSILIKDMQMPSECEYCGFCRYYPENGNIWCNATNRLLKQHWKEPNLTHLDVKRPDWCPLEEQPERKTGKWIERNPQNSDKCRLIECDQCGFSHIVGFNVPYEHWIENRNFCERCGAKMEGNR